MLSDRCVSVCPVCLSVCNVGVLWPNGWMDYDATWYGGRLRPRPLCVRWGPSSRPKRGTALQFSAHVYCGQTAEWIKMPLGKEVRLGPGDIVLDVDPAPPTERNTTAPTFRRMSIVAKRSSISATAELLLEDDTSRDDLTSAKTLAYNEHPEVLQIIFSTSLQLLLSRDLVLAIM